MSNGSFDFASGNLAKMLALPKYLLSLVFSWFIPRDRQLWVFGSGIGVGEGALPLALQLRAEEPAANITWMVADEGEARQAESHGFIAVPRRGWNGFWATLRAGQIVVTHGLGDVNRFGVYGGFIVQLWHGAPLKRLHLDSPVTTQVRGPAIVRGLLRRMYLAGSRQIDLYVAGSALAAGRLRSAFRVAPGKVRVLGDPRDDALAAQAYDPAAAAVSRAAILDVLDAGRPGGETRSSETMEGSILLYAPTWRDGGPDPGVPSTAEASRLQETLARLDAHLVIRPHPLGAGAYESIASGRVHLLRADTARDDVRDITPLLAGFDAVITDFSSIALDFALTGRPILWFAPDLEEYTGSRGLYEPLEVTASGRVDHSWDAVLARLSAELPAGKVGRRTAETATRDLVHRYHAFPAGGAAARVLAEVRRLRLPAVELVPSEAIFFESYYGRQVSCNPLALDREIARRFPALPRYWSVTSELQNVPEGAVPVLVGGREWHAVRRRARLLIVNDWLRYRFRRGRGQTVLQTWHGTMLKHLALGRPGVNLRTRLAVRRESRRWSLLLSQNPHATAQFRASYTYRGEILETGYPRDDRLARAVVGAELRSELAGRGAGSVRNPVAVNRARAALGLPLDTKVLVYAPTWRDGSITLVNGLDVHRIAAELGDEWVVVARGHTRTHAFGSYGVNGSRVVDVSKHDDVADVILAADLLVTDYSSIMFDAAVARVPQIFFVPDLAAYRDRERGFTFQFEREAPGPITATRAEVVEYARAVEEEGDAAAWLREFAASAEAWRARFAPHDDGHAAERVVDALVERGSLRAA